MENETNYIVKAGIYSFFANVSRTKDVDFIHIGGKKRCITLVMYHNNASEADLHSVFYSQHCDRKGQLQKRDGTVEMIKASITFLKRMYPRITKVILQDESYIECNDHKKQRLANYYIAVHGKTWYEAKLNAKPHELYKDEYILRLDNFKRFVRTLPKPSYHTIVTCTPHAMKEELRSVYDRSNTLQDMITTIAREYDCMMFRNWLDELVSQYIPNLMNITWEFEAKPMINIQVETIPEIPRGKMMMGGAGIPNTIGDFDSYR